MLGGVAGFHHQIREDLTADDRHAEREDQQPECRRRESGEGDPRRNSAGSHRRGGVSRQPASGAER